MQFRYERAFRALGFNPTGREVFRFLVLHGGCWPILKVADLTGFTRSAVRDVVKRNVARGYMARCDGGIAVTELGAALFDQTHGEALEIAISA